MKTIADIIRAGIEVGKSNEEILQDVYAVHPAANTKAASVSWYRSQMKKGKAQPPQPKTKVAKAVEGDNVIKLHKHEPKATPNAAGALLSAGADFVQGVGFVPKGAPVYTVGNYKSTQGMEGPGFIVTLFRNGKKVATASDYGDGGPVHWDWFDKADVVDVITTNYKDEEHKYKGTREEAMFALFCRNLPKYKNEFDETGAESHVTPDIHVEELLNDMRLLKMVRNLLKKVAFVDHKGNIYTLKVPPTPENLAKAKAKNKDVKHWLNEMPEAEALAIVRSLQS